MALPPKPFTDPPAVLQAAAILAAAQYSRNATLQAQGQLGQATPSATGHLVSVLQEMAALNLIPPDWAPAKTN